MVGHERSELLVTLGTFEIHCGLAQGMNDNMNENGWRCLYKCRATKGMTHQKYNAKNRVLCPGVV